MFMMNHWQGQCQNHTGNGPAWQFIILGFQLEQEFLVSLLQTINYEGGEQNYFFAGGMGLFKLDL